MRIWAQVEDEEKTLVIIINRQSQNTSVELHVYTYSTIYLFIDLLTFSLSFSVCDGQ